MEIVPNGKIYLLRNVPLNQTYENTIIFDNPSEQEAYFRGKCQDLNKYSFSQSNYQRVNKGTLRIRGLADDIMKCNYLMFKNELIHEENGTPVSIDSFDYVYAFIIDVTYINTNCAEIIYKIDVIQTFMFKYSLGKCYVDREHSETDGLFEHIIDEGLPIGDYEYTTAVETLTGDVEEPAFEHGHDLGIFVASTFDNTYAPYAGGAYAGTFNGLFISAFHNDSNGIQDCKNYLIGASTAGVTDGVVAVFLAPYDYVVSYISSNPTPAPVSHTLRASQFIQNFGNYTPKNLKMYTYPYNQLVVYNGLGNIAEYRLEKFDLQQFLLGNVRFTEYLDFSCAPTLILIPTQYENIITNLMESITCGPFPQIAWSSDTYKVWVAQNYGSIDASLLSGAVTNIVGSGGRGFAMGISSSPVGGLAGAIGGTISGLINYAFGNVVNTMGKIADAKVLPNQAHGNTNGGQLLATIGEMYFHAYRKYVREDYAESIDNFFTMYGYKTNKVKYPNVKVRKEFTYVKTCNCFLETVINVPAAYQQEIIDIYNNGIRFWVNPLHMGDYSLDNSPVPIVGG